MRPLIPIVILGVVGYSSAESTAVSTGDLVRLRPSVEYVAQNLPELAGPSGAWLKGHVTAVDTTGLTVRFSHTDKVTLPYSGIEEIQLRDATQDRRRDPTLGARVGAVITTAAFVTITRLSLRALESGRKEEVWSESRYQAEGGCPEEAQCAHTFDPTDVLRFNADVYLGANFQIEGSWLIETRKKRTWHKKAMYVSVISVPVGALLGWHLWSPEEGWIPVVIPGMSRQDSQSQPHTGNHSRHQWMIPYVAAGAGLGGGLFYVAEPDGLNKKPTMALGMLLGGAAGALVSDYMHHRGGFGGPSLALELPPTSAGARATATWKF